MTNSQKRSKDSNKSDRKGGMWSNLAWEKVDVESSETQIDDATGSFVSKSKLSNHSKEEAVNAVFFGLEVIDGSKYEIQKTKLKSSSTRDKGLITTVVPINEALSESSDIKKAKEPSDNNKDEKSIYQSNETGSESKDDSGKRSLESKGKRKDETQQLSQPSKKKKRKKSKQNKNEQKSEPSLSEVMENHSAAIQKIQESWSKACQNSLWLHPILAYGFSKKQFFAPTPIQAATLPASILGRRNIVGAAPTGSGKTFAYALPILQFLLQEKDRQNEEEMKQNTSKGGGGGDQMNLRNRALRALITCPTRELALQVSKEIKEICFNQVSVGVIVGGLAEQKQKRVLDKIRPSILVSTPGRLWELISLKEHSHLEDMSQLRFLVIDEADRMISQGSFPQLRQILAFIQQSSPNPDPNDSDESELDSDSDSDESDDDRLKSLHGVRGEAKVKMLDMNILAQIEQQKLGESPSPAVVDDAGSEGQDDSIEDSLIQGSENGTEGENSIALVEPRQTFVYSATLTLPSTHTAKKTNKKGKKSKKKTVEGAIADILEQAGASGQTKVVDLTSEKNSNSEETRQKETERPSNIGSKRLPPGLSLYQILCTQKHKDSHCYAFLATTQQGSSGPCLIFCNSIPGVKRVAITLQTLGLPVRMLHAQMSQKARFSSLESLKTKGSRAIVVATDVAARGLDIPSVATVIHYDVARTVDTFIHRAGRTARGVGKEAVGSSISLVAPGDDERKHLNVCRALQGNSNSLKFEEATIDGHLLRNCQERTALATKIVSFEEAESKMKKKNKWFTDAAKEAEIDLDEELLEDSISKGADNRDVMRAKEAQYAKSKLNSLLSKPMRKQNFGKFLGDAGMAAAAKIEAQVSPFTVPDDTKEKRKKKRKKNRT